MDQFEQKMQAAEQEGMKNMFLKLMDVCYERCVKGNYASGHMSKRELICTDECAAKVHNQNFQINVRAGVKV